MPKLHANTASSAEWQQHLDYMLPRAATLRVDQIAEAVGVDQRTVARAFDGAAQDAGGKIVRPWLLGFEINAASGQRYTRRIPRDAAILWLAESANYTPSDFLDRICEVLSNRSATELLQIQSRIAAMIKNKQA